MEYTMIDKFEWKNVEMEQALLDYVDKMAQIYVRPVDECNDVNITYTTRTLSATDLIKQLKEKAFELSFLSNITKDFVKRYNNKELTNYFTYEEYIKNEEIQKLLKELELDKDKFWFLILFAYDYSESLCINGVDVAPSAYEQLQTLINAINPCVTDFDLENGSTIDREIKMEVRIEGMKKPIIIDSPTAIHLLIDSCETRMEEEHMENLYIMNYRKPLKESKSLKDSPHIYYFTKMFLNFFDRTESIRNKRKKGAKHSLKEMEIASRLVYFTKLSTNKTWLDIENETLKVFIKQYKNLDLNYKTSNIYTTFLI